jgi:DNA-binding LacI/PurR family transcriptional regulator/DNA-binding transcriptional regulator YhcF (GntR family)
MISSNDSPASRQSLHEKVTDHLRRDILATHPGMKLDSEAQLAAQFGVSVMTLRQAMSILAHEGLIERRQGSGTYVVDTRAKRHVAIMSLAAEDLPDSSFQLRVENLLGPILQRRGYRFRFYVWMDTPEGIVCPDFVQEASQDRISGAVFVAMHADPAMPILLKKKIPFLLTTEIDPPGVAIDHAQMVRDGTRYLLDRGCRRIALMQWSQYQLDRLTRPAFNSVLAERGLKPDPSWIRTTVSPAIPGAGWEQFRNIWNARKEKPDGLLVTDDVMFRDVAMGILGMGIRVPEQLQVVTHANKGAGISCPFPVATLEVDPREYAEELATMLIQFVNNEGSTEETRYVRARLIPPAQKSAGRARRKPRASHAEPQLR